ncbi:hypothetical protein HRI_004367500 [Hibiscus trionum]|uniref:Aspartic peptidase DDI1-type domain-containing protein n=1 Tax=Hibiscus trionum TaxID=183268 RepID=A0A9W7MJJ0_HIBTR|nr:hypothetical protein HRI_004367500 [Hibiscus trionum]
MPTYAKFLKDIVTKKRKVEKQETVAIAEECYSIWSKLPPKRKDPSSFAIPCSIGDKFVGRALCDLGSSVNLMPKSIFLKLGIREAQPTKVVLQLADHSHVRPEGRIEDVVVKVDIFIFLDDFLILDCEADSNTPIILGRPFLATERALIDCEKGEFTMRVADQTVTINIHDTLKYADNPGVCQYMDATAQNVTDEFCCSNEIQMEEFEAL